MVHESNSASTVSGALQGGCLEGACLLSGALASKVAAATGLRSVLGSGRPGADARSSSLSTAVKVPPWSQDGAPLAPLSVAEKEIICLPSPPAPSSFSHLAHAHGTEQEESRKGKSRTRTVGRFP